MCSIRARVCRFTKGVRLLEEHLKGSSIDFLCLVIHELIFIHYAINHCNF
jgi:hypothetical protein